jgi:hypothetical protein
MLNKVSLIVTRQTQFIRRRLEEYERTLSILTSRIAESYTTQQFLINNLHILCTYLNSLWNEFDVIVENYERTSERFSLEKSYDRANGLYGGKKRARWYRPRKQVIEEQLTTIHCFLSLVIGNENHIGVL